MEIEWGRQPFYCSFDHSQFRFLLFFPLLCLFLPHKLRPPISFPFSFCRHGQSISIKKLSIVCLFLSTPKARRVVLILWISNEWFKTLIYSTSSGC
ncbi:hypothetical protein Nepgr_017589 [Nepenthes gracilis]|uniref:Uncharacterized protein n=1 Tax=Nepenthes gracilis TaxID=150966 RepID=A0AAD3XSL9_NEPGR|nr:hypothetical protein Nepgr_017589 [Nepenthes gracilis]